MNVMSKENDEGRNRLEKGGGGKKWEEIEMKKCARDREER